MAESPASPIRPSPIRLCALIPVYNHHQQITRVVEQLHQNLETIILIDDGSHTETAKVLDALNNTHTWIYLVRLNQNQGKGAAMCMGFETAAAMGFTHGLQVDADGQHDLNDVPTFVALAQEFPNAVMSGARDYLQMPAGRRSGRKLTDFWVRINTWSNQLEDSMCGFRLYPLAPTVQLIRDIKIGRRMDFDTDILVRLYWRGLSVKNVPTNILYSDEIPSHFDVWLDNLRISWMHTRLFFGMLRHIPTLAARRFRGDKR